MQNIELNFSPELKTTFLHKWHVTTAQHLEVMLGVLILAALRLRTDAALSPVKRSAGAEALW